MPTKSSDVKSVTKITWKRWTLFAAPTTVVGQVRQDDEGRLWEWVGIGKRVTIRRIYSDEITPPAPTVAQLHAVYTDLDKQVNKVEREYEALRKLWDELIDARRAAHIAWDTARENNS